ncbi:hypothetical protein LCGC14_2188000 [marine sediment metagenome]|uniref:Uncharacterized protein n=1 Tax=marine sediment metagenome TaxID=412755 RepID=A0A0F9FXS5_9ZZZZ
MNHKTLTFGYNSAHSIFLKNYMDDCGQNTIPYNKFFVEIIIDQFFDVLPKESYK